MRTAGDKARGNSVKAVRQGYIPCVRVSEEGSMAAVERVRGEWEEVKAGRQWEIVGGNGPGVQGRMGHREDFAFFV